MMNENNMGRIALNESQLRRIISEAARTVIAESILGDLCDRLGTKLLSDDRGRRYIRTKVRMGDGNITDYEDLICKERAPGLVEVMNPATYINPNTGEGHPMWRRRDELFRTWNAFCKHIEDSARGEAEVMGSEVEGYTKYEVTAAVDRGGDMYRNAVIVWQDGGGWGTYVRFYFSLKSGNTKHDSLGAERRARYNNQDRMNYAMREMRNYFNEYAETDMDFQDAVRTRTAGGKWIVEFLFDEPETIAAMIKDATQEMGRPPMKSPDGRMYVWRLD